MLDDSSFPAAEKILSDIENIIRRNPALRSFEIVPAQNNENRSPVYHEFNFLGLESWCVEPLYCYVYRRLLDFHRNRRRCTELKIVTRWLLGALLINPKAIMLWNMRRELVRNYRLDPCEELLLTRLVLCHKPNSYEAFAYRRWLMPQILDVKQRTGSTAVAVAARPYDPAPADSPLCAEVQLAESCADRYANNYHAWSYRRYLVTLRESRRLAHPNLDCEWRSTLAWCKRHVSDNSGHSYRQFLLRRCVLESTCPSDSSIVNLGQPNSATRHYEPGDYETCDREECLFSYIETAAVGVSGFKKMFLSLLHEVVQARPSDKLKRYLKALSYWVEECRVNETLISTFDCNEVLWCHRRFLAHILVRLTAMYLRHGRYVEDELLDARRCDEPIVSLVREEISSNDLIIAAHLLLVEAFRIANDKIVKMARERDPHERVFVEGFLKFTASLGFDTVT